MTPVSAITPSSASDRDHKEGARERASLDTLLADALSTAKRISDPLARAKILVACGPYFSEGERSAGFREALDAAKRIAPEREFDDDTEFMDLFTTLVPHLPEGLLSEAINISKRCSEYSLQNAIIKMAPDLSGALLENLVSQLLLTNRATFDSDRLKSEKRIINERRGVVGIIDTRPRQAKEEELIDIFDAAKRISDDFDRIYMVSKIAASLSSDARLGVLQYALNDVKTFSDEHDRIGALNALAKLLPPKLVPDALEASERISNDFYRAHIVMDLAERLSEAGRVGLLYDGLNIIKRIPVDINRAMALVSFIKSITEPVNDNFDIEENISDFYTHYIMNPPEKQNIGSLRTQFRQELAKWRERLGDDDFFTIVASASNTSSAPALGIEASDAATSLTKRERAETLPLDPFPPKLTEDQIKAIEQRLKERPWSNRPSHRYSAFEWVRDNFKEWIPGLTQNHLAPDTALYAAFTKRVQREGLPDWLDVPTEPDAALRRAGSTENRQKLLAAREINSQRVRRYRKSIGLS